VDVATRVVVQVGFPIVVAGVLLWYVLGDFQKNMKSVVERMANNTEAAAKLVETDKLLLQELQNHRDELRAQTGYLKELMEKSTRLLQIQEERQQYYRQGGRP